MTDQFKQDFNNLVQTQSPAQALQYAKEYLKAHPRDIEAWWFLATSVPNTKIQRQCCEHILKVDPHHAQARDLLNKLNRPQQLEVNLLENPLGLPTDNAPGIKPYKTAFVDEDPVDKSEKPWENLPPQPSTAKPASKMRIIGFALLFLVILWGGAGAVYYFFIYDREPSVKLNASIQNDNFTMQYPKNWQTQKFSDGRILVVNQDVPSIEMDAIANPWENLAPNTPSLGFFNFYISVIYNDMLADNGKDDMVVVVMQPVPQDATSLIYQFIDGAEETFAKNFITYSIEMESTTEDIVLGGVSTKMILLDTTIDEALTIGPPQKMKLYFVPVRQADQHYLLTMMVTEPKDRDWRKALRDIAENIKFRGE